MTCTKCGELIMTPGVTYGWAGPICPGHAENGTFPHFYPTPLEKPCSHCYCRTNSHKFTEQKPHKVCCNCGNRQIITNMEMGSKV